MLRNHPFRNTRSLLRNSPKIIPVSNHIPFNLAKQINGRYIPRRLPFLEKQPILQSPPSDWNIANAITISRICVAPFTAYCVLVEDYNRALAGLIYAGGSDALDGYLARRLCVKTKLGSILDPAADKLLITSGMLGLAYHDIIPRWLACLVVGKDVALVGVWGLVYTGGMKRLGVTDNGVVEPLFVSKVNTASQIVLMFAGVLKAAKYGAITDIFLQDLVVFTAITTVSSGVLYASRFLKQKKRSSKQR